MNNAKQKNRLYFFFSLIFTLLITACGVRNYKGFVEEDARFANYTFLDYGSDGLAYYVDEANPSDIAVGIGTCTDENIAVTKYTETVDGTPVDHNVTSVFPSGFQNCNTIKKITLPDTITTFGTDAFAGSSLETITIPKNLTAISSGAFRNCKSLESVKFKNGNLLNAINDYAFANCFNLVTFPFHEITNLTTIGKEAFLYCLGLTNVVFPDHFAILESYAFQDCKNLTTIYFPASIAYVASNAFRGVGESARIYFSENEPGSGNSSSSGSASSSITPVSLAEDFNFSYGDYYIPVRFGVGAMKFVGDFQFITPDGGFYPLVECTADQDVSKWKATGTVEIYEPIAENEVLLMGYTGEGNNISLDIPSTILGGAYKVVGIMNEVFLNKTNIISVTFHENLRFIDYGAFSGCTALKTIDLSGAVDLEQIRSRAFYNTMTSSGGTIDKLYSIHIPSSVQKICSDAFRSCDGLFRLFFDGATSEYEESFLCPATGSFSFELAYQPLSISSVTFDGPAVSYTRNGNRITIAGRKLGVAKVKYTTNSTTTQTFTGYEDDNNTLVSEFVLSGKTDAGSIGSVIVDNTSLEPSAYSITDYGQKSKITFVTAPSDGAEIVVVYRAQSKLTTIEDYAFYECSKGFGSKAFYGLELRKTDNPFSNVYFPASLTNIGQYAFSSGQFIGGVIFKSVSLVINEYAFGEQKSLSSITFPSSMTGLDLYSKCFASGLGYDECAAAEYYKKLISVTLPTNTTVHGNDIFYGHFYVAIYCIGRVPLGGETSFKQWNRIYDNALLEKFGAFGQKEDKSEMDTAPFYTVTSADDIITLPSKDHPIFDFVKEQNGSVTLANYHFYGGRIKDQDGDTAIIMGSDLTSNSTDDLNNDDTGDRYYNSEYAVLQSDGHFRLVVPYKVSFGEDELDVTKIGKAALALQINKSKKHPRGDSPTEGSNAPDADSTKYWWPEENLWTTKEIILPNSITIIDDIAMAFVPFTTINSYSNTALTLSGDGSSKIWNNNANGLAGEGKFPSSLTEIRKKALVFSAITCAKLPSCLQVFGNVTSSGPNMDKAFNYFPFMGCFELTTLEIYSVDGVDNPVFSGPAGMGIISHAQSGKMIEGAGGKTSISIPWGTTQMVAGALRGGRKIQSVLFPYTLGAISTSFLDTIGNARDKTGRSGKGDLTKVEFGGFSQYPGAEDDNPTDVPLCTSIDRSAFYGCSTLEEMQFPCGLTQLGQWAFRYCTSLSKISFDLGDTLGDTNKSGHLDFTKTPALSSFGQECFQQCVGIKEVTTNSAMIQIGSSGVFTGCTGLETLNLNSATKSLSNSCFSSCSNLTSVSFNTSTGNTLGQSCFSGCKKLTSITFNGTKNTIGVSCFSGCTKLETITFSVTQNTTTLQNNAFENCSSLKILNIPSGVTVKNQVFKKCTGLSATGGYVFVDNNVDFDGQDVNSAFIDCNAGTKIFLMDNETTYSASTDRYPSGWNCWSYSNGSGSTLPFYCYSSTQPSGPSTGGWGYWHYDANNVPTPWTV